MRQINQVAFDIRREWKKVNFAAAPYLSAMMSLTDKDSSYGLDSAQEIVARFLCNAGGFRGGNAKAIKAELKAIMKGGA